MQTFKHRTNSGKQLLLDVTQSLKNCPKPKLFGEETKAERKLLPRNRVVYYKDHPLYGQPRHDGSKPQDVTDRQTSLATYGFDYAILPPQVIPDPEREGWYIGLAGWTWDKALDNEGVPTFIYDVIDGGSPLDIRKRKNKTNILPPEAIRQGNTERSLTAETIDAIANNELDREDEVGLWDFICEIAADKSTSMKNNIYNAVRKEVPKLDDSIYLWHSQGTGDHSFAHPTNAVKTGSIDGPRSVWEEDFKSRCDVISKFVKLITGVYGETDEASKVLCKTIEENMEKNFLRSNDGHCHLPQKREAYAKNGGGARETTMVNKFGKSSKK